MVGEIRLYVEGGGDKDSKASLREAFSHFLAEPRDRARERRVRWTIVLCGSRSDTHAAFRIALKQHPQALNLLLVDSERPVRLSPAEHLADVDDAWEMEGISDDQCHLMAQAMEAWFVADPNAIAGVFGKDFQAGALPKTKDVESIDKDALFSALKRATQRTQKGEYHKTRHAPQILKALDSSKVRPRAKHCERLFTTISEELE